KQLSGHAGRRGYDRKDIGVEQIHPWAGVGAAVAQDHAVAVAGHVAHANAVGLAGVLVARERLSHLIGAGGGQGAAWRHAKRVGEVSTGLDDIGEDRAWGALLGARV